MENFVHLKISELFEHPDNPRKDIGRYLGADGNSENYWRRTWNAGHAEFEHAENAKLDLIYKYLRMLGYEMSSEELACRKGEYPLEFEYDEI